MKAVVRGCTSLPVCGHIAGPGLFSVYILYLLIYSKVDMRWEGDICFT